MLILNDSELRKKILKTSVPAMVEMFLYMLIGVVDIAVVGRLGAAPLAAVSLGAEMFFSIVLFLSALGMGSSVLLAQAKGAGRKAYADRVAAQSFSLALIIGLITAALGLLYSADILRLFNAEAKVYEQSLSYLLIVFKIAPFAMIYYVINYLFRGLGRTDIPMKIAVVTNIINISGDFILVYGFMGLAPMGVSGAALATAIAHLAGFVLAMYVFLNRSGELNIKFQYMLQMHLNTIKEIVVLGMPSLTEEFLHATANFISMFLIVFMGTLAFAAHNVALTVESISFMPGFGVAIAAVSLVGQAVGAKDRNEALRAAQGCTELLLITMGFFALIFALFPSQIASLFTNDTKIIPIAALLIRLASLEQLTIALSMVLGGVLKGSGDTKTPMYISFVFTWLWRLPMMYLFTKVLFLSISYIWLIFVLDWFMRALSYAYVYKKKKAVLGNKENTQA